ncbi:hypothetical protein BGZ65_000937 [Modicella reniformis]|uniref:Protein kinase domain-containing protein n=1 Tax=Modicella reniformis TaxID=1440133 RepID=A0A9P6IPA6_9FUNG|nr:hypothetical protein BGZ65_000937 [Modicella reniformis]
MSAAPSIVPCKYKTGRTLGQGTYAVVKVYLVTELAEGGELFDRICKKGNYYEHDAAHLPENLLFKTAAEDSQLLIADFGLSRIIDQEKFHLLTTTCGTPGYMAPEIFQKSGHGKPVDMWALGVITYFLLCGYTPFDRQNSMDEMHAILSAEYQFAPVEYWQGVSETAKSFINGLLTVDPSQRMTAAEAMAHPFLAQATPQKAQEEQQQAAQVPQDSEPHDLLPSMMSRMMARSKFRNAVGAVRAMNSMRAHRHEDLREVHTEDVSHVLHREDDDMV